MMIIDFLKYKATDNFDFNRIDLSTNLGQVTIDLWILLVKKLEVEN